ncbi:Uncharacterized protein LOCC1_G004193 [Lachnellula occidentalis]|uniref:Uncharacterized protein n=1 Tax=Lachnellula occidentalis TaxID=215460 RepID=A0A8H8S6D8_9HELO|nr:Uncharacterized protein LOCC1_G004193 [Lachnellula occidentalis]
MAEDEHANLEPPPRKSMEDPGAHDLESSDDDDHFSDAQSDLKQPTGSISPVPLTRVEKVDGEPSHGEVPGTAAYDKRVQDAAPDEIEVIPEGSRSRSATATRPTTPGGQPIPITVVEKVDPEAPSHGEVPGTPAHDKRAADAVPDVVVKTGSHSRSPSDRSRASSTPGELPIPVLKVEKVDSTPSHGEVPGTHAYDLRKGDAEPDIVEEVGDAPGKSNPSRCISEPLTRSESPTSGARSQTISHTRRKSSIALKQAPASDDYNEEEDGSDGGFGDDFDDFEEGEEDAEFGDFDEGFQEPAATPPPQQSFPSAPLFVTSPRLRLPLNPLRNPDSNRALPKRPLPSRHNRHIHPPTPHRRKPHLPHPPLRVPLVTTRRPSPLQPPNWIRSRIRRLFLVSLGVPVDLDEILPASKQKKLILPSTNLQPRTSSDSRSVSRLKQENSSSTSVDSQGQPKRSDSRRRKGPPPAPVLDLVSARQACAITDEALNGLTMDELKAHVGRLDAMQGTANEVLEYWTKRTDEKLGDREAFEGVIENLVKHARKTRK